ncbi:MAG TPA: hypothetical protein VHE83_08150 [Mycobacteriales bacterium]|nr:hypothetical protein [Mycobacteriales bacterium]
MSVGPLVPADELFVHQITDTFATVGQADRSWTEKLWAVASAPDGSLQVDLGLGLYPNRGVIDGYAGVSRGVEQWTVRASGRLSAANDSVVGPIGYAVTDPLVSCRFTLAATDAVPIAFDWTFTGVVPPFVEERELKRSHDGRRIDSDIVRFHHTGTAHGWVEVDGVRTDVDGWVAGRDRSWGVRYMIGEPPRDMPRPPRDRDSATFTIWSPILCTRADGSRYGLHLYYLSDISPTRSKVEVQGGIEEPDGSRTPITGAVPVFDFDPRNRRLRGGRLDLTTADGTARPVTVEAVGDTGFHLGTGLYFSFDGSWHGQWHGDGHVEGEHIADCSDPETARRVHQIRDCIVRVDDPVGGGTGIGTMQTIAMGAHPATNLSAEGSFV